MSRRPASSGFWDSLPGALTIIGLLALVSVFVLVRERGAHRMVASVEACGFEGAVVKVALRVRNVGREAGPAQIEWAYQDLAGNRVEADPTTVAHLSPGESVRHEATAPLDIPSATVTCEVTAVR
ncbi:hypothetical protein Ais01nite_25330 [Asanoa ishikariensis]|uniref:Uncharacterized protein n=2 Tax=Asanoa ishikariensis TaxID=137265 RepID=A0A1H3R1K5_9ACTN|nr:hypothetical protein Ais01nite_25330 [Asanoa ishikariensis]SDZ19557.1 hypothetical protein SAMN05421684_3386 [Asanoa ishikariensis]